MAVSSTSPPASEQSATLIDRLYTVPDEMKVGRGQGGGGGEREGEAHRRLHIELMKYRRTAQVYIYCTCIEECVSHTLRRLCY